MKTWQIYTIIILVSILVALQAWSALVSDQKQSTTKWEYSSKDMLDVDASKINFAEENDWLKEGWEPIMPLYVKESTGTIRVLVRRPQDDK